MNAYNPYEGIVEESTEELSELDKAMLSYIRKEASSGLTARMYEDLYNIKLTEKDCHAIYTLSSDDLETYILHTYPELFI